MVEQYGLTAEDIFGRGRRATRQATAAPGAPKYRDPESGSTWSGRGKPPGWIRGKDREQFLIG